ncbi:MAG: hydroxyacid dehydrogenase [Planctomycetes bacterium]|nr:hydroxyacid dehydrogenase [Planctomycetota bacterium]
MAFTVAIPQDITEPGKAFLRDKGYTLVIGDGATDADAIRKNIATADAILARTAPFTAEILAAAPNLKVIGRHGIGVDNIDVDYCTKRGIWVTFAPNSNAISVAEHTVGFMIAAAHNFVVMDRETRAGNWEIRNQRKGCDLQGKTVGVIGLGRIGRTVADLCRAFGMEVLGYDAFLTPEQFPAGVTPATVDEIFARADFVTLHVPSTPETRGLINAQRLGSMKKTAVIINCARGDVANEQDLYEALKNRTIAGAALDVFAEEPAAADNPLFTLDNVIVTPHNAALTVESMDRMGLHAAMGIDAVLSGKRPEWPVNNPAV